MFWKVPLVSFTHKQLNSKTTVTFYVFTRTQWNSLGRAGLMSYASQDALKHNPTANTDVQKNEPRLHNHIAYSVLKNMESV